MASIMISAVAFVATFEQAPAVTSEQVVADLLERRLRDFIENRFDWPLPPGACLGKTRGDQWLVDAASSRENSFREEFHKRFEPGIDANLILDNLHGPYMFLNKEFDEYAIAWHSKNYDPNWSGAFSLPTLGVATGAERLEIQSASLVDGELQLQKGEGVEVVLTLDNGHQKHVWASTALLAEGYTNREFAQNLTLLHPKTGQRTMAMLLDPLQVIPEAQQQVTKLLFALSPGPVLPAQGASVMPAGTRLEVQIPPAWTALDLNETPSNWNAIVTGDAALGWSVIYTLNNASTSDELIRLDAKAPTAPKLPFDIITADVFNGSLAHAEFVIQYPGVVEKGLPVTLHTSVPYPVRLGSSTILGVALANAGNATKVKSVDYILPGGFDMTLNSGQGARLFAPGQPVAMDGTGAGGSWSWIDAKHIRWSGTRNVSATSVAEWLVSVNITSDATQATSVEPPWSIGVVSEITFDNAYVLGSRGGGTTPGFLRSYVRPDDPTTGAIDGYPYALDLGSTTQARAFTANITSAGGVLSAGGSYTVLPGTTDLGNIQNALGNASTRVSSRIAPLGSFVTFTQDVESILTTLADRGAGAITLSNELYVPAGLGCGPVAVWTRNASTLPSAVMNDIAIYDETGLGAPSVYVAASDQNAYKVGASGNVVWSRVRDQEPTIVRAATMPVLGPSLFVGEVTGNISRLDPTLTGSVAWSVTQDASNELTASSTIRGILPDPSTGKLLVWSDQILEVRNATDGALLARLDLDDAMNRIVTAVWATNGSILLLDHQGLERFDDLSGSPLAFHAIAGGVGLAITNTSILVANTTSVVILDMNTLGLAGEQVNFSGAIKLASPGDATTDGVQDLVVALDTLAVHVVSGATGQIVANHSVALSDLDRVGLEVDPFQPISGELDIQEPVSVTRDCPDERLPHAYEAGACLDNPENQAPTPLILHVNEGQIMYSHRVGTLARTVLWKHTGEYPFEYQHEPAVRPTATTLGTWAGTRAFVIATSDGQLTAYDDVRGLQLWASMPTASTGQFSFTLRVPLGGFFGTNVLLTRIQWTDPVFGQQQVVLPEWFQVVAPDGRAVLNPLYVVRTTVQLAEYQMTDR